MTERRLLAISGTPGTGKTELCDALTSHGWEVLRLADLAAEHGCLGDLDSDDGAAPVDIHRLEEAWTPPSEGRWLVDGHLAHFLEVDAIVLLRCSPTLLRERLQARGYDEAKINANAEWELTAGHWSELIEFEVATPVLELNTTHRDTDALVADVLAWLNDGLPHAPLTEQVASAIDWLKESFS